MKITLYIWRQKDSKSKGKFAKYVLNDVTEDMSFLEMLDMLNFQLESRGEEPIAFESDCREGICGACSLVINGKPHGPWEKTTTCQLHLRAFKDGDVIYVEPWRSTVFPVLKDLIVDRSAFDRIITAGGFISVRTGAAPDANTVPVPKKDADTAFDAATCIGCGACVAACPNGSAALFTAAKVAHLAHLPQGRVEREKRVVNMVRQMDKEGFGGCTNTGECQEACPKGITINFIAQMNREYIRAFVCDKGEESKKLKVL
ncbi:MAG: succinate dehydrogenase/fumarate reductase iron-sulfur subunit [Candidatus Dadabacteria bacterium]|nr:MAG: succinate dehydrogenase/fumarate reductase iron-sulfur subunit [Candidatus Dadabacteria bacterium]